MQPMIKLKVLFFLCLFSCSPNISRAQSIVEVAESTLKVSGLGEEVFYYGFAEGDKLIFDLKRLMAKS